MLSLRFGVNEDRTRIVLDMTEDVPIAVDFLASPPRLFIDLPKTNWNRLDPATIAPKGLVKDVRYGNLDAQRARLILELDQPAKLGARMVLEPRDEIPYFRIVVDIIADKAALTQSSSVPDAVEENPQDPEPLAQRQPPNVAFIPQEKPSASPSVTAVPAKPAKRIVAIDAGHGGRDPGAIASNGVLEKNITLDMAFILADALKATGKYEAYMTRVEDRGIRLRQRIQLARENNADIFISLHADSFGDPQFRGASVYTLSDTASDEEARLLAERENKEDIIGGINLNSEDPVVTNILIDLAQRNTNNLSIVLADEILRELKNVTGLVNHSRRFAGFAVLKAPDMPSVLVELGYLSNAKDTAALLNAKHRRRLAAAIVNGINGYFDKMEKNP